MPNDLSARLRDFVDAHRRTHNLSKQAQCMAAAADLIDQQAAEIERLRAQLYAAEERVSELEYELDYNP